MKKFIEMFLAVLIVFGIIPSPAHATVTEYKSDEDERFLWEELSKYSPSDEITAGIMGYFMRESQLKSDAVHDWNRWNHAKGVTDSCREFVEEIDAGLEDGSSKDIFFYKVQHVFGGFGLGQWYGDEYLEHFYSFVRDRGGSIADAELQCEFIFESLQHNEELWNDITQSNDPFHIGRIIGYAYDGTGELGAETIASYSRMFYKEYAK